MAHKNKQTLCSCSIYTGVYTCPQTTMGLHDEMHLITFKHDQHKGFQRNPVFRDFMM